MKVLTISGLANYLHIHRSTIYRLLKRGELPGFKIGSDWRFNIEAMTSGGCSKGRPSSQSCGSLMRASNLR